MIRMDTEYNSDVIRIIIQIIIYSKSQFMIQFYCRPAVSGVSLPNHCFKIPPVSVGFMTNNRNTGVGNGITMGSGPLLQKIKA